MGSNISISSEVIKVTLTTSSENTISLSSENSPKVTITPIGAPTEGGEGSVDSVNGKTGAVVLTTTDIDEGTNEYFTEAKVSANTDVVENSAKISFDTGSSTRLADTSGTNTGDQDISGIDDNSENISYLLQCKERDTTQIETEITEIIDLSVYGIVKQVSNFGLVTSFTGHVAKQTITVINQSGGANTLNITVDEVISPKIYDGESLTMYFNGTDWSLR